MWFFSPSINHSELAIKHIFKGINTQSGEETAANSNTNLIQEKQPDESDLIERKNWNLSLKREKSNKKAKQSDSQHYSLERAGIGDTMHL